MNFFYSRVYIKYNTIDFFERNFISFFILYFYLIAKNWGVVIIKQKWDEFWIKMALSMYRQPIELRLNRKINKWKNCLFINFLCIDELSFFLLRLFLLLSIFVKKNIKKIELNWTFEKVFFIFYIGKFLF